MTQAKSAGALAGTRVIDLSRVLGGPFCSQIPRRPWRRHHQGRAAAGRRDARLGPALPRRTPPPISSASTATSAASRSISRSPTAAPCCSACSRRADVLIENFKTGTLERWGMGYDERARSENFPRLIHCRVSGFGADGPLGGYPGYDAAVQAHDGADEPQWRGRRRAAARRRAGVDIATGLQRGASAF